MEIINITFTNYQPKYLTEMTNIWNDILQEGNAFPGIELFNEVAFEEYINEQSIVTCMLVDDELAGYYVVHPNNIGHCSHVANASYAMSKKFRGQHLFTNLVENSLIDAKKNGFKGMQYNAVVTSNCPAIKTYKKHHFEIIGTIPNGFQLTENAFSDIHIMYCNL